MWFKVERTSLWTDEKPCEEAFQAPVTYTRRSGTQVTEMVWFVEINSLEELIEFHKRHGSLVIEHDIIYNTGPVIEIYDDYRE